MQLQIRVSKEFPTFAVNSNGPWKMSKIIENKYHGDYCLIDRVRIGECAFEKLRQIGNRAITTLVEQLEGSPSCQKV